mmetsp:Transcript_15642/g.32367  ORF Transcript_15642/g.32367 Transcript_15642/m.32367 type:complete len:95 (+) Transcript_15642:178-462(+)
MKDEEGTNSRSWRYDKNISQTKNRKFRIEECQHLVVRCVSSAGWAAPRLASCTFRVTLEVPTHPHYWLYWSGCRAESVGNHQNRRDRGNSSAGC